MTTLQKKLPDVKHQTVIGWVLLPPCGELSQSKPLTVLHPTLQYERFRSQPGGTEMGRFRFAWLVLALLLCMSPQTTYAKETIPTTGDIQHYPYFEGWLRIDANLPLYQPHDPTDLHVGLITSGHFAYTAPGAGPRLNGLLGISFSDHQAMFGLYGGGSLSEERIELGRLPFYGVVGWRMGVILLHHVDLVNETMFFVRKGTSAQVLSQSEILSPAFGPHQLFAVGIKNIIGGDVENPREDFKVLTGSQLSFWLLNQNKDHGHHKKPSLKFRVDLSYKVGPCWIQNRLGVAHEGEVELLFLYDST